MKPGGAVRVGCSGWQYKHWRGDFYPAELATSRWFAHYALSFDTVEINNTFYRLPEAATFARWSEQAPKHFLYSVKASRLLTHMKKLKDPEAPLLRFFERTTHLGLHLGPTLFQLPPAWPIDLERLEHFLETLARTRSGVTRARPYHAIEFRDPSWYDERTYALLNRYKVALCLHDMEGSASDKRVVGPFIYVRFHFGTRRYGGRYDDRRLDGWGEWLSEQASKGLDVFAYFNNDEGGHAPRDAVRLKQRIQQKVAA